MADTSTGQQKGRVYYLLIGDKKSGEAIEITKLHMTFEVSKSVDKKKRTNSASIEVYNMNEDQIALLDREQLACQLSIGYENAGGPKLLVSGNVVECRTVDKGPDTITQIIMGEGYTALTEPRVKALLGPGEPLEKAVEEIRKQMPGISRGVIQGGNLNNPVLFGYRLHGTPRDLLDEMCEAHDLECQITQDTLHIVQAGRVYSKDKNTALVINEDTGLIESPFHTSGDHTRSKKDKKRVRGTQFRALANAELIPGAMVRLESERITGWYRVHSIRFYGGLESPDWYMEVFCNDILEEDKT